LGSSAVASAAARRDVGVTVAAAATTEDTGQTEARRAALEVIAAEVRSCTKCRLAQSRNRAVPGEGHPDTEVVFVGEGPGQTEDQQGRPFVGRAGELLVRLLSTLGWRRQEVFITNIVKCRPPGNRDPEPDEIAACAPYLRRQLEVLDPAVVVTLGRFSMAHFRPGERITQIHGTAVPAPSETGTRDALVYALYHPAAALRSTEVERQSYDDIAGLPRVLLDARARRGGAGDGPSGMSATDDAPSSTLEPLPDPMLPMADPDADAPTLFQSES
jgi:DNA polymerase